MTLRTVRCPDCASPRGVDATGGRIVFTPGHVCGKRAEVGKTGAENSKVHSAGSFPASTSAPPRSKFSNAKPTTCGDGHRHPSKLEARTCDRLTAEAKASGWTLVQQVAFELTTIAPKRPGLRHKLRVDFLLVPPGWRAIESKGRESRDFRLRADAFAAAHGKPLEIVTK